MLDDFRKMEIYRDIEKVFDEETVKKMEEEILQLFDLTQCPNCTNCFKNLQDDNKRLRERLEKLEEENLSLRNKLNRE
jgi:acyl-homoserine lactone acylase PvdQ